MKKQFILLLALLLGVPTWAWGGITQEEFAALPPFCKVKMDKNVNNKKQKENKWRAVLGKNYIDIHHYCIARINVMRAQRNPDRRSFLLLKAENNFSYMIRHAKPGFVLLPEILARRGKVYHQKGNEGAAISDFRRALEVKPDYTAAYSELADLYMEMGEKAKAEKVLEQGIKRAANPDWLKKRMNEITH